jgi:hypothetical protein
VEQDPFAIAISFFRNTGYSIPIVLQDAKGAPFPTEGYAFRLEIVAATFDRSWTSPPAFAQQNICGSGASGTVFVLHEEDTAGFNYRTAYKWRVLAQAPGGSDAAALIGGPCQVFDGPAMPELTPF